MSEKRFTYISHRGDEWDITDNSTNARYISLGKVVELLNEQQATIQSLKEENEKLRKQLKWKKEEIKALLEEDDNDE